MAGYGGRINAGSDANPASLVLRGLPLKRIVGLGLLPLPLLLFRSTTLSCHRVILSCRPPNDGVSQPQAEPLCGQSSYDEQTEALGENPSI